MKRKPSRPAESAPRFADHEGFAAPPGANPAPPVAQLSHRERLAAVGVLAAGVGHEINNPLASILACVQGLERRIDEGLDTPGGRDEARELCRLLVREVDRCKETTHKLMLLAQPYSTTPRELDFNAIVSDTLALLHFQIHSQGIEVIQRLEPQLPPIHARDSGMRSIAMNLLLNAVQAMPSGGVLRVSTASRAGRLQFEVQDTGPGIPGAIRDHIWEPFFTTKPPGQGTGLGLPVTEAILRRHGGTIEVDSPGERGARFSVSLPFREEESET